jgi:outer membrane protein TolC
LFSSRKNTYKVKQTEAGLKAIEAQKSYTEDKLRLQLATAIQNYRSAVSSYQAAQSRLAGSEKYYGDMIRLYKEGMAIFIELLDAQNEYVTAKLQLNIGLYDMQIKLAEIERANASFNLQNQ